MFHEYCIGEVALNKKEAGLPFQCPECRHEQSQSLFKQVVDAAYDRRLADELAADIEDAAAGAPPAQTGNEPPPVAKGMDPPPAAKGNDPPPIATGQEPPPVATGTVPPPAATGKTAGAVPVAKGETAGAAPAAKGKAAKVSAVPPPGQIAAAPPGQIAAAPPPPSKVKSKAKSKANSKAKANPKETTEVQHEQPEFSDTTIGRSLMLCDFAKLRPPRAVRPTDEGAAGVPELPEHTYLCHDCGGYVSKDNCRLTSKLKQQYRCKRCRVKVTQFYNYYGTWPPKSFSDKTLADRQHFMSSLQGTTAEQAAQKATVFFRSENIDKRGYHLGGQFLPLTKWAHDGFNAGDIEKGTPPEDIIQDPILGTCYRVKIMATYESGSNSTISGDETKGLMKLDEMMQKILAAMGTQNIPEIPKQNEPSSSESESATSSSSSSSSDKKKSKKSTKKKKKKKKKTSKKEKKGKKSAERKRKAVELENEKKQEK